MLSQMEFPPSRNPDGPGKKGIETFLIGCIADDRIKEP